MCDLGGRHTSTRHRRYEHSSMNSVMHKDLGFRNRGFSILDEPNFDHEINILVSKPWAKSKFMQRNSRDVDNTGKPDGSDLLEINMSPSGSLGNSGEQPINNPCWSVFSSLSASTALIHG